MVLRTTTQLPSQQTLDAVTETVVPANDTRVLVTPEVYAWIQNNNFLGARGAVGSGFRLPRAGETVNVEAMKQTIRSTFAAIGSEALYQQMFAAIPAGQVTYTPSTDITPTTPLPQSLVPQPRPGTVAPIPAGTVSDVTAQELYEAGEFSLNPEVSTAARFNRLGAEQQTQQVLTRTARVQGDIGEQRALTGVLAGQTRDFTVTTTAESLELTEKQLTEAQRLADAGFAAATEQLELDQTAASAATRTEAFQVGTGKRAVLYQQFLDDYDARQKQLELSHEVRTTEITDRRMSAQQEAEHATTGALLTESQTVAEAELSAQQASAAEAEGSANLIADIALGQRGARGEELAVAQNLLAGAQDVDLFGEGSEDLTEGLTEAELEQELVLTGKKKPVLPVGQRVRR